MYPLQIPTNLNNVIEKYVKTPNQGVTKLIKFISECSQDDDYSLVNLRSAAKRLSISLSEMEDLFGAIIILVKWSKQILTNSEKQIKNCLYENKFTEPWVTGFLNIIVQKDPASIEYPKQKNCLVRIEQFKWCINISLFNSTLKRSVSPTIIWTMMLSDGRKYSMEISLKKFHEIRFHIAYHLKEMNIIKNRNLFKKQIC